MVLKRMVSALLGGLAAVALANGGVAAQGHHMAPPTGPAAASGSNPTFAMPEVKEDPNPVLIQGPAGEIFRFVRTGASTCGRYLMAKATIPPGAGPIPHVHHWTDEYFFFPTGGFTMFMGSNVYPSLQLPPGRGAPKDHIHLVDTPAGGLYYGPRYHVHGLVNSSNETREMVFIWMPDTPEVSILNYFKAVGQVLTDVNNPPPISTIAKILFVTEAPKWGINQSSDFFQYVETVDRWTPPMDDRRQALVDMLREVGDGTNCPK
jgi:mannose-6-phosphate isomerase-like protein (cupin superfamily)